MQTTPDSSEWPTIRTAGVDGLLVSFGAALSEPANRAALAFRAAVELADWPGVEETATSLVSAYLRFDPGHTDHAALRTQIEALLKTRDWLAADLPAGRRLWRIPTVFGGTHGPQLEEAAALAGMTPDAAIADVAATRVRVQTIGFAAGQPYLGSLNEAWDIPRQTELTRAVPVGALTVAIRQIVLFSVSTPTGWRQIGRTAFRLFRPEAKEPFVLRPGDEVLFDPVPADRFEALQAAGPDCGAEAETLP